MYSSSFHLSALYCTLVKKINVIGSAKILSRDHNTSQSLILKIHFIPPKVYLYVSYLQYSFGSAEPVPCERVRRLKSSTRNK